MADTVLPVVANVQGTGSNLKGENVPVHVTSIRLNKDNYLSWSAALEIGITSKGRLQYITEKPAPAKNDPQWATWTLEDSQVKVWLISYVSADIQPLILRKSTAYEMWTILARMYGHKKLSEERDSQMEGSSVVEQFRDHLFGQVYSRKEKNVMEVGVNHEGFDESAIVTAPVATTTVVVPAVVADAIVSNAASAVVVRAIGVTDSDAVADGGGGGDGDCGAGDDCGGAGDDCGGDAGSGGGVDGGAEDEESGAKGGGVPA
ncbi:hypothetical protein EJ110_NYTH24597 [Nymphaea thermarum]|nr:hypothetical protein EJ110_NYTH24597 [Nymphaea thermarum]